MTPASGAAPPGSTAGVARIAMWSGPRTLSTALMRSFENRPDTVVVDEPLYGYYLAETGIDHPGRDEIVASMPTRWPEVVDELTSGLLPAGRTVYYQKHMTHHLLPGIDRSRLAGLRHAFLIRDPRRLLASYAKVRHTPTLADLGLEQQAEIYRLFGGPVIDAADLAARPRESLQALCGELGIPFDEAMLSWPAGPRETDGVWARHWYARVWASTGFTTNRDADGDAGPTELSADLEDLAARCEPFYAQLAKHRLPISRRVLPRLGSQRGALLSRYAVFAAALIRGKWLNPCRGHVQRPGRVKGKRRRVARFQRGRGYSSCGDWASPPRCRRDTCCSSSTNGTATSS